MRRWLEPLVKQLGVSVIVTDDLVHYKTVIDKLDVEHQICQFHVRRWVGRALKELRETVPEEWRKVIDEVKQLISELPPEGSKRLFELWKQIPERRVGRDQPLSPPGSIELPVVAFERTLAHLSYLYLAGRCALDQ